MIDWVNLAFNSIWIIALALALAVFSYASFQASQDHLSLRSVLQLKAPQTWFSVAGLLFCVGLAGTSSSLVSLIVWSILAALFIIQLFIVLRSSP